MKRRTPILSLVAAAALLAGCARSPAVGTWTGTVKSASPSQNSGLLGVMGAFVGSLMDGPCTLTLKPDGTGFLKVPVAPERPISWKQEENKVTISTRTASAAPAVLGKSSASGGKEDNQSLVATLAPDKKSMTLDFGVFQATLTKQPDSR